MNRSPIDKPLLLMMSRSITSRLKLYAQLIRIDKPVGIFLLLWPTLWGLWTAKMGLPDIKHLIIFVLGTIITRSAGCAINDFADRNFDVHVERTKNRPLTSGKINSTEAIAITVGLTLLAWLLIQGYDWKVKSWAVFAAAVAASYPFMKRWFAIPQAYLGLAFGLGIPMAHTAINGSLMPSVWLLVLANLFWAIAYDTAYAMVDRKDDLKIGIRTSAITFGHFEVTAIAICYGMMFLLLWIFGQLHHLQFPYYGSLLVGIMLACYWTMHLRSRNTSVCLKVFQQNQWLGLVILLGLILGS